MEKNVKVDADSLLGIFCTFMKMQKVFLRGAWEIPPACKAAWEPGPTQEEDARVSLPQMVQSISGPPAAAQGCDPTTRYETCVSYMSAFCHALGQSQHLIQLGMTRQEPDWFHVIRHISVYTGPESETKPGSAGW